MGPKKEKVQPKKDDNDYVKVTHQVKQSGRMAGEQDAKELSELIRSIMREEISVVVTKLDAITEDISACIQRLDAVDETLSEMDGRITVLETACESLHKANAALKEKAERLETQSRRCNLRVFGVPDEIEKGNPTSYMNSLFKELFKDKLMAEPEVEIAHRTGTARVGGRPMVVRLRKFSIKEEILKVVKGERVLHSRGMKLKIFPDLTTEVARKRASFWEIRGKLKNAAVRHGIIHPATLILTFKGETKKFTEPSEAETYYKTVIEPGLKRTSSVH